MLQILPDRPHPQHVISRDLRFFYMSHVRLHFYIGGAKNNNMTFYTTNVNALNYENAYFTSLNYTPFYIYLPKL